ncbi:hypothetical protein BaRGS_00015667 [Batillaria attramentaria]|uniref:F-box domain-containing protein n=1 Tax=Batillaria attramentaria TaxID=370345 RepID=A0ABD0L1M1_9CAEN
MIGSMRPEKTEKLTLWTLPEIELGCILDFLHWRDKISLQAACPEMSRVLMTPLGWRTFKAGEISSVQSQRDEVACVQKYGHLFQHCTLWLGRPCRNTWECTCVFDVNAGSMFPVLSALVDKCKVLKSLRLYHPSHVTPESNDTDVFKQYQHAIEKLLLHALHRTRFSLELCGLQYSNDHIRPISLRFFDYYVSNPQVSQLVTVLDVSRSADNRLHPPAPLNCLPAMTSLVTLKVPVHCVTMGILQSLVQNCLCDLYLLSDDSTVDLGYDEQQHLHWLTLLVPRGRKFHVHYIFKQRTLTPADLVPNPYVRSVCIDSPCRLLTEDLLVAIADRYGNSLQLLALSHSAWKPDIMLLDLSNFAAKCPRLTHFVSTLLHPTNMLVSLVENAPRLKDVLVVGHGDEMAEFMHIVSQSLHHSWQPRPCPSMFHIDSWELSFLLDEYILRYSIPVVMTRS